MADGISFKIYKGVNDRINRNSSFPLAVSGILLAAENEQPVPVVVRGKLSEEPGEVVDLLFDKYLLGDFRNVTIQANFPASETVILTAFISTSGGPLYDTNRALSNFVGTAKKLGDVLVLKHRAAASLRFESIRPHEWELIRMILVDHQHLL